MHIKKRQKTNEGNPKLKQFSLVEERAKKIKGEIPFKLS